MVFRLANSSFASRLLKPSAPLDIALTLDPVILSYSQILFLSPQPAIECQQDLLHLVTQ